MDEESLCRDVAIAAAEALSVRYFGVPYPESCRLAVRDEITTIIEAAMECVVGRVPRRDIRFSEN